MTANTQLDEMHGRLVGAHTQNPEERLGDALLRLVEDPLRPLDEHSRFRVNPILLFLTIVFALVLSTFLFFTLVQS